MIAGGEILLGRFADPQVQGDQKIKVKTCIW